MNIVEELNNIKEDLDGYLDTHIEIPDSTILKSLVSRLSNGIEDLKDDPKYLPDILPCPFCGNTNTKCLRDSEINNEYDDGQYACLCSIDNGGCGSTGGYCYSRYEAITLWNRRNSK